MSHPMAPPPTLLLLLLHPRSLLLLSLSGLLLRAAAFGVNWGTLSSHPLPPEIVVQILQSNNITKVKLFDADPSVLQALAGTGIEVMVGIANDALRVLAASSLAADAWVHDNVTRYMVKGGVNIKYVAVGNEPFLAAYGTQYQKSVYPALSNLQQSLAKAGLGGQVKVTVPCNADVLQVSVPSKGAFRPDVKDTMTQIISLLSQINSPIIINIYPFLDLSQESTFPVDYAFFDGTTHAVQDGAITYTNAFDASVDMLVAALGSIGFPGVQIIVGEIGWPTDGGIYANISYAQRFNQGLVKHVLSKQGTPLRPGVMEIYIFSLLDENQKNTRPGNFERHWGIFTFDGQPKYQLDLTGQGLNQNLVSGENVQYLPSRWCIANPNGNMTSLPAIVEFACAAADCTPLSYGGSCNNIGAQGNASYAFNSYYQLNNQEGGSCSFDGLGLITFLDPSIGDCRFLIGVSMSSATWSCPSVRSFTISFFTLFIFMLTFL